MSLFNENKVMLLIFTFTLLAILSRSLYLKTVDLTKESILKGCMSTQTLTLHRILSI